MKKIVLGLAALTAVAFSANKEDVARRLKESGVVLSEIMSAQDKSIPQDLLDKAHCIVIVPGLKKGAFIFGGKYGKGFISCRRKGHAGWSAPGAVRIEGGSVGFQIGGSETDVILLVLNARGADRLLQSKFTIGAEGEVAAGPVGRNSTAQTDAKMTAEILSWNRSRGVFAGISLQGATLREDMNDNQLLYGTRMKNSAIVERWQAPSPEARALLTELRKYSPKELD